MGMAEKEVENIGKAEAQPLLSKAWDTIKGWFGKNTPPTLPTPQRDWGYRGSGKNSPGYEPSPSTPAPDSSPTPAPDSSPTPAPTVIDLDK
jgi:hypothetical protein